MPERRIAQIWTKRRKTLAEGLKKLAHLTEVDIVRYETARRPCLLAPDDGLSHMYPPDWGWTLFLLFRYELLAQHIFPREAYVLLLHLALAVHHDVCRDALHLELLAEC